MKKNRTIDSTMLGSASVERSPSWSPSPAEILRRIRRMICGGERDERLSDYELRRGRAYLSRASLGEITDENDPLGCGERTDRLAHLEDELLEETRLVRVVVLEVGLHRNVSNDSLASELVGNLGKARGVSERRKTRREGGRTPTTAVSATPLC